MKKRNLLVAGVLGALALSGSAHAIDEVEQNQGPLLAVFATGPKGEKPQVLSTPGDVSVVTEGAAVNGVIGVLSGTKKMDVDVFQFFAQSGAWITVHVEAPTGGRLGFSSILALFSPQDDGWRNRAESWATTAGDPMVEKFALDKTGTWSVVLSPNAMTFGDGGVLETGSKFNLQNGPYKLVITAVPPPVVVHPIEIAVKPGSGARAPINPKARGVIPVALLSGEGFDPQAVDVASLTFGATGEETSLRSCSKDAVHLNSDTIPDLVCHFENQLTGFTAESSEGFLKGKFTNATGQIQPILGRGILKAVPPKLAN